MIRLRHILPMTTISVCLSLFPSNVPYLQDSLQKSEFSHQPILTAIANEPVHRTDWAIWANLLPNVCLRPEMFVDEKVYFWAARVVFDWFNKLFGNHKIQLCCEWLDLIRIRCRWSGAIAGCYSRHEQQHQPQTHVISLCFFTFNWNRHEAAQYTYTV